MKRALAQVSLLDVEPSPRPRRKNVPSGATDNWFTPMDLFQQRHALQSFTLDVCGHPDAPVSRFLGRFYTQADDGLTQSWDGERIWANVPFSDVAPWVERAHWQVIERRRTPLVEMLLPANRTEQPFWQKYIEPFRDRLSGEVRTTHLPRRRKFGHPGDPMGATGYQPQFGLVLVTWRLRLDVGKRR